MAGLTKPRPIAASVLAAVAGWLALFVLIAQIEVTGGDDASTRACGSAFDSIVDRSGWQDWWRADLDDPAPASRTELVRTRNCPGAVNTRIGIGTGFGLLVAGGAAMTLRDGRRRSTSDRPEDGPTERLARLARLTTIAGAGLTLAGVAAILVLVADADSTLFLYTDRLVVAVVGLIVLVPPIALIVFGRAMSVVATGFDPSDRGGSSETGDADA